MKLLNGNFLSSLIVGILLCFSSNVLKAQNGNAAVAPTDTLVVGVAGSQPFMTQNKEGVRPEGISVDIWEDVADKANWNYRYKSFESVDQALYAVERGDLDVVVGPISITSERMEHHDFSQPFFQSSLSIVSRSDDGSLWATIKPFFSFKLLAAVAGFLFILAIVGTLFWLAERKKSPDQFSAKPMKGIGNGMWLAIVTMSTVGYGDMAPRTAAGRIIAGSWIVIAIISATSMVAGIASVLTMTGMDSTVVQNIEQLSGRKTATIMGSPATSFIKEHNSKLVTVNSLDEAMALLEAHKVDAVIYDRPQLLYYIDNHKGEELFLAKAEYYKQGYGFAFPLGSELVNSVNLNLLEMAENQKVRSVIDQYIGEKR